MKKHRHNNGAAEHGARGQGVCNIYQRGRGGMATALARGPSELMCIAHERDSNRKLYVEVPAVCGGIRGQVHPVLRPVCSKASCFTFHAPTQEVVGPLNRYHRESMYFTHNPSCNTSFTDCYCDGSEAGPAVVPDARGHFAS